MCVGCKHGNQNISGMGTVQCIACKAESYTDLVGDEDTITVSNGTTSLSTSSLIEDAWNLTTPTTITISSNDAAARLYLSYCGDDTIIFYNSNGDSLTKLQLLKLIEDSKWSRKMGFSE